MMSGRFDFVFSVGAVIGWIMVMTGLLVFIYVYFSFKSAETTTFSYECPGSSRVVTIEVAERESRFGVERTTISLLEGEDRTRIKVVVIADFSMSEPIEAEWEGKSLLRLKTRQATAVRKLVVLDLTIEFNVVR